MLLYRIRFLKSLSPALILQRTVQKSSNNKRTQLALLTAFGGVILLNQDLDKAYCESVPAPIASDASSVNTNKESLPVKPNNDDDSNDPFKAAIRQFGPKLQKVLNLFIVM